MKELIYILTTTDVTQTLQHSPDGWDESQINWKRSEKYHGMFRSFTIPLKFIKDGASLIRSEVYTYGSYGYISLLIRRLNKITMQYETAYNGLCDISTMKDTLNYVEVNVIDGGLAKLFMDNESADYAVSGEKLAGGQEVTFYGKGVTEMGFNVVLPQGAYFASNITTFCRRWIDKATNGGYTAGYYDLKSDYLDSIAASATIPSGSNSVSPIVLVLGGAFITKGNIDLIGEFKTTFADFFSSLNTLGDIGVGVEYYAGKEVLRIERRSYFFNDTVDIMDVGNAKELTVSFDNKVRFNRISIGFPQRDYTNYNSISEVNATSRWQCVQNSANNELELVSKFRGDACGMVDIAEQGNYDNKDDIFFAELTWKTEEYEVPIEGWYLNDYAMAHRIGGTLPDDDWQIGNMLITPRRCLLNQMDYINSCLWGLKGSVISFLSADNDIAKLETKTNINGTMGAYVAENTSITVGDPVYFYPLLFEIETAFPYNMIAALNQNSKGRIIFEWENNTYYGFPMEVGSKISGRSTQKIKLRATMSNDLTNLSVSSYKLSYLNPIRFHQIGVGDFV